MNIKELLIGVVFAVVWLLIGAAIAVGISTQVAWSGILMIMFSSLLTIAWFVLGLVVLLLWRRQPMSGLGYAFVLLISYIPVSM